MQNGIKTLLIPNRTEENSLLYSCFNKNVIAIIPTYNPTLSTVRLVGDMLCWNPTVHVVIVNDSTPEKIKDNEVFSKLQTLASTFSSVHFIETPVNKYKAGAINYGLAYIKAFEQEIQPEVIITMDDDIVLEKETITHLLESLYRKDSVGAACTEVRVVNKNTNLLTRLQGLEYHGFNISKIADNGCINGPLVMQGMLVAFRYEAICGVSGFTEGHLIEDYDITAKLKTQKWEVVMSPRASAWTEVPEKFSMLWKQRVRWTYWGLKVIDDFWKHIPSVFQDLFGHIIFVQMIVLIGLSFSVPAVSKDQSFLVLLLSVGVIQFVLMFAFNIFTLTAYKGSDLKDWLLRLTVIPELVYSNVLTLVLLGSYLFYFYNRVIGKFMRKNSTLEKLFTIGLNTFNNIGYSVSWGTR